MNPLLDVASPNSLPAFTKIKADHVESAMKQVLNESRSALEKLCQLNKPSLEEVITCLQEIENKLSKVWSPISHLNAVMNNDELRRAYTRCLPMLSNYRTEMGQNLKLFQLIKSIRNNATNAAIQRLIDNYLVQYTLAGADLNDDNKLLLKKINSELTKLSSRYSDNVLDSTNSWTKSIDKNQLSGLSESIIDMLEYNASQNNESGWLITLDFPVYNAIMTFADDRELRKQVYTAYSTRASGLFSDPAYDNSQLIEDILHLKNKKAKLLGFTNYAELSLHTKMAEHPNQVIDFLHNLMKETKNQAISEVNRLAAFASDTLGIKDLKAWDVAYVSEKLKNNEFNFSEEDLKPWFSVDTVLKGLFDLVEHLYDISIKETNKRTVEGKSIEVEVWHEDVKYYQIYRGNNLVASFYLDLYSRKNKRGGAWMDSYCGRCYLDGELQIPVAYLNCNSSQATGDKPALFTHDEVKTLFHEFGHGLHHMLTTVDYLAISGISGVEWDAVELPSQFMENWCWERKSLDLFAKHYKTGELIPDDLFVKMQQSRHFNSAMAMLRQIEFSLFDMRIHMDTEVRNYKDISHMLDEVRQQTAVLAIPEFNRFQNSFTHIFAGGYSAGYYSYKWAEVLSADVFDKFEEKGLFNEEIASRFLHEILEKGGSRPAKESFFSFRGRPPDVSALLRHNGIQ